MITNFVFSPSHSLLVLIIRGVELLAIKDQIYSQVLQDIAHLLPLTLVCLSVLPAKTNTKIIMCVCTQLQILHSHHHILYLLHLYWY